MAKNKNKRVKVVTKFRERSNLTPQSQGVVKNLVEQHNKLGQEISKLHQLSELNRVGVVSVNTLMTESEWPTALQRMRQFVFAIINVFLKKYPELLDEVHTELAANNFKDVEKVLGSFDIKVGYSKDDFQKTFAQLARTQGPQQPAEYSEGHIDEEGSEEEAQIEVGQLLQRINLKKSQVDSKLVEKLQQTHDVVSVIQNEVAKEIVVAPMAMAEAKPIRGKSFDSIVIDDMPSNPDLIKYCAYCHNPMDRPAGLSNYNWEQKRCCSKICSRNYRRHLAKNTDEMVTE
jgi:hypothetical protein